MTARPLLDSDIPALGSFAAASGYPYPDLSTSVHIESIIVIADDQDRPIMACAAERIVQLYLWAAPGTSPAARLHALRLLHDAMSKELKALGYDSAEAFVPPSLAKRFGRRLMRTFQWTPNWPSFSHKT